MLGALTIQRLLLKMKEVTASDLHIKVGSPPTLRIASVLHAIDAPHMTSDDTQQLLMPIVPERMRKSLDEDGCVDFSHHEGVEERFRCSIFHAGGGLHLSLIHI